MEPLAEGPVSPADSAGRLVHGRWRGGLAHDPVALGPRRGRVRRWYYVGAGDAHAAVGAAVVDLGAVAVAFAWAVVGGCTLTWEARRPLGLGAWVSSLPDGGAGLCAGGAEVRLGGDGGLDLDVPVDGGRLRARVEVTAPSVPVVLSTPTPRGGWNVTQKSAGDAVVGSVTGVGASSRLAAGAGGWRDWTSGRQDRHTHWRWAAGTGTDAAGRRVGLNLSTGMNGRGPGEDLVWWEGAPQPVALHRLAPEGRRAAGAWEIAGHDLRLRFEPWGVRSADERLLVLRSSYVQPIGRFEGTLPGPDGAPVAVTLTGVTEDHLAVW